MVEKADNPKYFEIICKDALVFLEIQKNDGAALFDQMTTHDFAGSLFLKTHLGRMNLWLIKNMSWIGC